MCHGADGLAATPMGKNMKILSFKDPKMISASNAQFFASTKEGKGKMPAYKGKLTDQQIKDVIAYIRTLQK
jgi:mono/diheme cytochrome c family protein